MAACWRCGSPNPPSAPSCPACGIPLDSGRADPGTLAEPTNGDAYVEAERDETSPWLIVVGLSVTVGLVGFFLAVGRGADSGEPEAAAEPPTTTTTTVPAITGSVVGTLAVDEPVVVDGHVIGLVAVETTVLAFAAAEPLSPDGVEPSDVSLWELDADGAWLERGVVLPGVSVSEVVDEPGGLVAVGVDADGRPTAWRSIDGVDWDAQRLHEGTDHDVPISVAAVDGLTVVAARPIPTAPNTAAVWDDRGTGWRLERLERSVDDLHPGPPGEILVSTSGASGPDIARFDGVTWFDTAVDGTEAIERWRDGFVAHGPETDLRILGSDLTVQGRLVVPGAERGHIIRFGTDGDRLAVATRSRSGSPADIWLATTTDGRAWAEARIPTGEADPYPERVRIVGDRIVVAWVDSGTGAGDVRTLLTAAQATATD